MIFNYDKFQIEKVTTEELLLRKKNANYHHLPP